MSASDPNLQVGKSPTGANRPSPQTSNLGAGQTKYAGLFEDMYHDQYHYISGIGWHEWDGSRWAYLESDRHLEAITSLLRMRWAVSFGDNEAIQELRSLQSASAQNGIAAIASHSTRMSREARDMDSNPFELNTTNGILDLSTFSIAPPSPQSNVTKVTNAAYDPDATAPVFTEFLQRVLPDPTVRSFLQEFCGLTLSGRTREHILAIATGTGANGKTTFVEAVANALGDYAYMAEPDLLMSTKNNSAQANPAIFALRGSRFVVTSETEEHASLSASLVKHLTGGDTITARTLYMKEMVKFPTTWTIMMVTNHLPEVNGLDDALFRRVQIIPFDVVIPESERDTTLPAKLELEADGILLWALQGLQRYTERGHLNIPEAVRLATRAYQNDSDSVQRFIDACAMADPNVDTPKSNIWSAWQNFCKRDNSKIGRPGDLYKQLSLKKFPASQVRINGTPTKCIRGLKLIDNPDDDVLDLTTESDTNS